MTAMSKQFRWLMALFFVACCAQAQTGSLQPKKKQSDKCSCGFSSYFNVGVLEGEAGTSLQLQTIQGMRYGKWFTGIGAGLDYYYVRTVPVFIDVRRTLLNRRHSPFAYADAGMHFPWARDQDHPGWGGKSKFSSGLWYDVGLGYRLSLGGESAFLLSAGYSFLNMKETRTSAFCLIWPNCQEIQQQLYRYKLNRLSLKIGVSL